MMRCPVYLSNTTIMNKYLWMSRQLRNFNEAGSIINWANAMHLVKCLLIEPQPTASRADNLRSSSPLNRCSLPTARKELTQIIQSPLLKPSASNHPRWCLSQSPRLAVPTLLPPCSHPWQYIPTAKLLSHQLIQLPLRPRGERSPSHQPSITTLVLQALPTTQFLLNLFQLS